MLTKYNKYNEHGLHEHEAVVCTSVSTLTSKLYDGFSQNLV